MNVAIRDWLDKQDNPSTAHTCGWSSQDVPKNHRALKNRTLPHSVTRQSRYVAPSKQMPNTRKSPNGSEGETASSTIKVPCVKCDTCDKLYASNKSLKIHVRIHTGYKPYACYMCPKKFAQTNVLKAHISSHIGRRDFVCKCCGKAFTQSAHLRTHQKIHDQKKDYECFFCSQAFASKGVRDRHIRQHTGEKPYKCTLCFKTFTRGESLKFHHNSHQGLRPYHCAKEGCTSTFTKQSSLKRHIGTCHSEDSDRSRLLRKANKKILVPILMKAEELQRQFRREPSPESYGSRSEGFFSRSTSCSVETVPYADDVAPDYDAEMEALIKDLKKLELLERLEEYVNAITTEEAARASQNEPFPKREQPGSGYPQQGVGMYQQIWNPLNRPWASQAAVENPERSSQCRTANYPVKCETPFDPMYMYYQPFAF